MHRRCHRQAGAAALAAAASAAAFFSYRREVESDGDPEDNTSCARGGRSKSDAQLPVKRNRVPDIRWMVVATPPPRLTSVCRCEALLKAARAPAPAKSTNSDEDPTTTIAFFYEKLDPDSVERTSLLDSHAVFGALRGEGLIERYNVYQRVNNDEKQLRQNAEHRRELAVVDLKLGRRLNGHGGIVHGGIISLLFDESMGWAYECLKGQREWVASDATVVTANLTVDFRAPFLEGSEAIIRVFHDETRGRKIYFSATLESLDGSVVFAEAKSLFILVRSDLLKKNAGQ